MSKNGQKVVETFFKKLLKNVKKLSKNVKKVVKKLSKSYQNVVKNFVIPGKNK
jgi:hypothetical protein